MRYQLFFFFLDFHSKACFLCGSCTEASNCFLEAGSHSSVSPAKNTAGGGEQCVCVCAIQLFYHYTHTYTTHLIATEAHIAHVVLLECLSALQGIFVFVTTTPQHQTGTRRRRGWREKPETIGEAVDGPCGVFKPLKRCFHWRGLSFSMAIRLGGEAAVNGEKLASPPSVNEHCDLKMKDGNSRLPPHQTWQLSKSHNETNACIDRQTIDLQSRAQPTVALLIRRHTESEAPRLR